MGWCFANSILMTDNAKPKASKKRMIPFFFFFKCKPLLWLLFMNPRPQVLSTCF